MISFCSVDHESFRPQQLREGHPLPPHGRKPYSGKAEPFNPRELINPKQPMYPLHIFQALSTSSSHVNVESGLRLFGDFSVPRC